MNRTREEAIYKVLRIQDYILTPEVLVKRYVPKINCKGVKMHIVIESKQYSRFQINIMDIKHGYGPKSTYIYECYLDGFIRKCGNTWNIITNNMMNESICPDEAKLLKCFEEYIMKDYDDFVFSMNIIFHNYLLYIYYKMIQNKYDLKDIYNVHFETVLYKENPHEPGTCSYKSYQETIEHQMSARYDHVPIKRMPKSMRKETTNNMLTMLVRSDNPKRVISLDTIVEEFDKIGKQPKRVN